MHASDQPPSFVVVYEEVELHVHIESIFLVADSDYSLLEKVGIPLSCPVKVDRGVKIDKGVEDFFSSIVEMTTCVRKYGLGRGGKKGERWVRTSGGKSRMEVDNMYDHDQ